MAKFDFKPKGVIPAMVTPFNNDESINEENLRNLVNKLIDQGVHALLPCGTTGEFVNMTSEENLRVIEIVVDETNGRVPVIAGTGNSGTKLAVDLTKKATDIGIDAAIIITPFYLKPSPNGLFAHYSTIAEKTDIPILLYSIPQCTGVTIPSIVVKDLVDNYQNFVGLKDSSGNFEYVSELLEKVGKKISIINGYDGYVLQTLMGGGAGMILASANVIPAMWVELYNLFENNKIDEAKEFQGKILEFSAAVGRFGTVGTKECLNMLGIPVGITRKPLIKEESLSSERLDGIRKILEKFGTFE